MPIVTLTTDIGQNDYIIGAIKGQLLTANPAFTIVDITHTLSPYNYLQAAYICSNAYKYYPAGTFHILLINLFETPPTHLLLAEYNKQWIACPDNGILTLITGNKPPAMAAIPITQLSSLGVLQCTQPLATALSLLSQGRALDQVGEPRITIDEKYPLRATYGNDWMEGQIIFIDNFENVVVNITQEEFETQRKGRSFKIVFTRNEMIDTLSQNYASVAPGEKMAWFNSAGYLEIAMNKGNMAGLFGLQGFNESSQQAAALHNKWFYQTVRIFFE
jgi:S-adenosylmethionine hydrolase